ncbi:DUF2326 domain-containing protein [Desulfobulbus sp. F5]|nr:DUF2326 domain-containing protein [Desulfobulbus sp. F5]
MSGKTTGNNVGKTTVLKLIDFCLGAKPDGIYSDQENKRNEYKLVKDFLEENKVMVSLLLKDDLFQEVSREVIIERNFMKRKNKIQRIDGNDKKDDEFEEALTDLLFPGHYGKKPTFRQIIAHNIRYKDLSINNTLKNLDRYTRDDEYETLYLFLFGCDFEQGDTKQALRTQIDIEEKFWKRLESEQTKSGYEAALNLIQTDIDELERQKASLNLNPNFESDLEKLNKIKYQINLTSSEISRLELRKELILEAQKEIQESKSNIDLQQLKQLYDQATSLVNGIQKTFQDLYEFHNQMVESKIKFVKNDLPKIDTKLTKKHQYLNHLLSEKAELSSVITQSDSFKVLEQVIVDLNKKYQEKGNYENILGQLSLVEAKLDELNKKLIEIDDELFSDEFALKIKEQINKFNKYFSYVSNELYDEKYALKFDEKTRKGRKIYNFEPFNTNFSSGKKQGEISCFDIAYTLFADEENISCMHFLLNDKKELMHGNQLIKISNLVNSKKIQFIASILKDKIPDELNSDEYFILELSQNDKLFRI